MLFVEIVFNTSRINTHRLEVVRVSLKEPGVEVVTFSVSRVRLFEWCCQVKRLSSKRSRLWILKAWGVGIRLKVAGGHLLTSSAVVT